MISAVVLVKNEEENIIRCLKSLAWCDETIIVDDYSGGETLERIKNKKIKIYKRHLNGDFASQRNFGLEKARNEWVLFVDADEVVTGELKNEIQSKLKDEHSLNKYCGFYIKRRDYFLGKWLKYGETGKMRLLRLARRDAGRWERRVHETWNIQGKIGELDSPLHHFPHKNISSFLEKINYYADIVVQCWKEEGKKIYFWEIIFYPAGKFVQNYILRLGFLDGVPGLMMAIMMSFHSYLSRAKFWLAHKNG